MRWTVAGGLIESADGLLLVQNRRRDGSLDWSPPGGVIEVQDGESVTDGLTREVLEETGIVVERWAGPVYRVLAEAPEMGWSMTAEIHRAVAYSGRLQVDDPDGIVVDARFVPVDDCRDLLGSCHQWVGEPLLAWIAERWVEARDYRYDVLGTSRQELRVMRR